jgi:hypothetical protein
MRRAGRISIVLAGVGVIVGAGCPAPQSDDGPRMEETHKEATEVPSAVRDSAERIAAVLGPGASCVEWFWDSESSDWECTLEGLSREAELDIATDGTFRELELVYSLDEVDAALPETGAWIHRTCRDFPGELIELSLRRERHLDPIPTVAEAWKQDGVVLEIQCPDGEDYEIDARGLGISHRGDDLETP